MITARRAVLLARQRWTTAELCELTGLSRWQIYRLRQSMGVEGAWTYAHQLRGERDLWEWLHAGSMD